MSYFAQNVAMMLQRISLSMTVKSGPNKQLFKQKLLYYNKFYLRQAFLLSYNLSIIIFQVGNYHLADIFRFLGGHHARFTTDLRNLYFFHDIPEWYEILCCWSVIVTNTFFRYPFYIRLGILSFLSSKKKRKKHFVENLPYITPLVFSFRHFLTKSFHLFFFIICNSPFMNRVWVL